MHIVDNVAQQLIARLQDDPGDRSAFETLKAHYQAAGDSGSLINLLVGWAERHDHAGKSAAAFAEAAYTARAYVGDQNLAQELYGRALTTDPNCVAAVAGYQELLAENGLYEQAARFLSEHISALQHHPQPGTAALLSDLYLNLGTILRDELGDPQGAATCFVRAQQLDPENPNLAAQTAPATGDDGPPSGTRSVEAGAGDPAFDADPDAAETIAARYIEFAAVQAEQEDDLNGAITTLRSALREVPGDVQVMHQLALYLMRRAPLASNPLDLRRAAELLYQIGQGVMYEAPADAMTYLESALSAEPTHDGALDLLEQLAASCGQEHRLPPHWVAFLAHAAAGPEADRRRLALGRAYAQAGQLEDAIFCLEQLPPNHGEAAGLLSSLVSQRTAQANPDAPAPSHPVVVPQRREPRRPTPSEMRRADDQARIGILRREVHRMVAEGEQDSAAARCRDIIDIDPGDSEAFHFLENHYRRARDHGALRDLLLSSTRAPGVPVDTRRSRLLEVASLSEHKLDDVDTAVDALQGVVTLSAADTEATGHLKRLLTQKERWDDLVALLERETLSATGPKAKAAMLEELAQVHLTRRDDRQECAEALLQLHELRPEDKQVRAQLCELLVQLERYETALPLLRQRADEEPDPQRRAQHLRDVIAVAATLPDPKLPYTLRQELVRLVPDDLQALQEVERVAAQRGDTAVLAATLLLRAAGTEAASERAALYLQAGTLFGEELQDTEAARDAYTKAIQADPSPGTLHALSEHFEQVGRSEDLAGILQQRARQERDPGVQAACYRQLARIRSRTLEDPEGASQAYMAVLKVEEDLEALDHLAGLAERRGDIRAQVGYLERAQALAQEPALRCDRLHELALLQLDMLDDPQAAQATLMALLTEIDPAFGPAAETLQQVADATGDRAALALALEARLRSQGPTPATVPLAQELATLHEDQGNPSRAIMALRHWGQSDSKDPEPMRRLCPLLAAAGAYPELLDTLDAWIDRTEDEAEVRAAVLEAARVSFEYLDDPPAAWTRLQGWVEEGDEDAAALLLRICREQGWIDRLINLHVQVARNHAEPSEQARRWLIAARLLEEDAGDPERALEAAVRALGADLESEQALSAVEQLCLTAGAADRLTQVYDRLIRKADDPQTRRALLLRHAELAEQGLGPPGKAFERAAHAWLLAPEAGVPEPGGPDETARVERLAVESAQEATLLELYDQHIATLVDGAERTGALVRAARFSASALADRQRAVSYLAQALTHTEHDPERCHELWAIAAEFDAQYSGPEAHVAQRGLLSAHRALAQDSTPEFASFLVLHAAQTMEHLGEFDSALSALYEGVRQLPDDDAIYDRCLSLSTRLGRLEELDAHLEALIKEAIDSSETVTLLRRRGALLEGPLGNPEDAAQLYDKLLQLRPDDRETAERLRASLHDAGRFQALLVAIKKQLARTPAGPLRLALLKEAAETWERGLGNRYEAFEAWQRVLAEHSLDPDALSAIERLAPRITVRSVEELLGEEDGAP